MPPLRPSICLSSGFLPQNLIPGQFFLRFGESGLHVIPDDVREPFATPPHSRSLRCGTVANVAQLDRRVLLAAIADVLGRRRLLNLAAILYPGLRAVTQERITARATGSGEQQDRSG
jgi:hypothetical protein